MFYGKRETEPVYHRSRRADKIRRRFFRVPLRERLVFEAEAGGGIQETRVGCPQRQVLHQCRSEQVAVDPAHAAAVQVAAADECHHIRMRDSGGLMHALVRGEELAASSAIDEKLSVDHFMPDDLIESEVTLTHWRGAWSRRTEEVSAYVDGSEVCATTPTVRMTPTESEYEGYMGNYGNTIDRWYHRAAVIVWPAPPRMSRTSRSRSAALSA